MGPRSHTKQSTDALAKNAKFDGWLELFTFRYMDAVFKIILFLGCVHDNI